MYTRVPLTEVAYMNLSVEMKKLYWFDNIDSPSPPLSIISNRPPKITKIKCHVLDLDATM